MHFWDSFLDTSQIQISGPIFPFLVIVSSFLFLSPSKKGLLSRTLDIFLSKCLGYVLIYHTPLCLLLFH